MFKHKPKIRLYYPLKVKTEALDTVVNGNSLLITISNVIKEDTRNKKANILFEIKEIKKKKEYDFPNIYFLFSDPRDRNRVYNSLKEYTNDIEIPELDVLADDDEIKLSWKIFKHIVHNQVGLWKGEDTE